MDCINHFLNKPWFSLVCSTSPLKIQWEKEKLLVTKKFLLFLLYFLLVLKTFYHFYKILNCRLKTVSVLKSLTFLVWEKVNTKDCRGPTKWLDCLEIYCDKWNLQVNSDKAKSMILKKRPKRLSIIQI